MRVREILANACKCRSGDCYKALGPAEVLEFLNQFQERTKLEQDAILYLACSDPLKRGRHEYHFLGRPMRRQCWETLLGISSHRTDRIGALDERYGNKPMKPYLTSSIDSFCMVLYNSIAEPLPNRPLAKC